MYIVDMPTECYTSKVAGYLLPQFLAHATIHLRIPKGYSQPFFQNRIIMDVSKPVTWWIPIPLSGYDFYQVDFQYNAAHLFSSFVAEWDISSEVALLDLLGRHLSRWLLYHMAPNSELRLNLPILWPIGPRTFSCAPPNHQGHTKTPEPPHWLDGMTEQLALAPPQEKERRSCFLPQPWWRLLSTSKNHQGLRWVNFRPSFLTLLLAPWRQPLSTLVSVKLIKDVFFCRLLGQKQMVLREKGQLL